MSDLVPVNETATVSLPKRLVKSIDNRLNVPPPNWVRRLTPPSLLLKRAVTITGG